MMSMNGREVLTKMSNSESEERILANLIWCPECNGNVPIFEDQIFSEPPTEIVYCPECQAPIRIIEDEN